MAGMLSNLFSRTGKPAAITTNGESLMDDAAEGEQQDEQAEQETERSEPSNVGEYSPGVSSPPAERAAQEEDDDDDDEEEEAHSEAESAWEDSAPPKTRGQRRRGGQKAVRDNGSQDEALQASESGSSEAEQAEWEGDGDEEVEAEIEVLDPNRCIFCGEDESNDPSEDFEEYLACASCGDNAHRQCARDGNSLRADEDAEDWRCPGCVENDIEPEKPEIVAAARRTSSVNKIARDLLPPQKGIVKPGSHSVFSKLILDDDPMDGSRALRKRKQSDESADNQPTTSVKRQKKSQSRETGANLFDRVLGPKDGPTSMLESDVEQAPSPKGRTRLRLPPKVEMASARVVEDSRDKFVIALKVGRAALLNLDNERKKQKRRDRDRARRALRAQQEDTAPVVQYQHYPSIPATTFSAPFYSFQDRDIDDTKTKPYGGILTEAEADTTKTFPQLADRKKFDDARQKAEEEWRARVEASQAAEGPKPLNKASGPPSKIKCISFGGYEIDTWHAAPYPEEYSRNRTLYICEFCLKYMNSDFVAWRHKLKCPAKHPPGDEIYRDGAFSFFEVDGRKNPVYCQNLCLLAKLFLGSKTLYYDVEPFLFYVMTENDEYGCHFVGYFSKEKRPSSLNNVSCILVLPIHQRRGFGQLLIEFSYLLTRNEKKTGSPEKPLSDMGLVSYRSYWRLTMCIHLLEQKDAISIVDISDRTGMTADDIVCALEGLRALVRDPVTKTYALRLDHPYFQQYIENHKKKGYTKINPDALIWTPYVMGRDTSLYDNGAGPQIHAMVQRDEEGNLAVPEEGVQLTVAQEAAEANEIAFAVNNALDDGDARAASQAAGFREADSPMIPYAPMLRNSQSSTASSQDLPITRPASVSPQKQRLLANAIPATRFEVFPPLPGTVAAAASKRKPGRPFGSRSSRRGTPVRRSLFRGSPAASAGPASLKKRKSMLADVETLDDGDGDGERDAQDEGKGGDDQDLDNDVTGDGAVEESFTRDGNGDADADDTVMVGAADNG